MLCDDASFFLLDFPLKGYTMATLYNETRASVIRMFSQVEPVYLR